MKYSLKDEYAWNQVIIYIKNNAHESIISYNKFLHEFSFTDTQSNWVVCARWWNGVPLACYMLGSSGHNTDNLTTNRSGAPWWERCHVPRTLKNPFVVISQSLPSSPYFQW